MKKKIFKVTVKRMVDDSPDTSTLGQYTDTVDDWHIDRQSGEYIYDLTQPESDCEDCQEDGQQCSEHAWDVPSRGREFRFFKPYAGGEKPGTDEYRTYGQQDYKRSESLNNGSWCYIGIRAKAETGISEDGKTWKLDELTSGGLWGIESDSEKSYLEEVKQEELGQLRKTLSAYGFSKRQIDKAFEEVEEEEP